MESSYTDVRKDVSDGEELSKDASGADSGMVSEKPASDAG